MDPSVTISQVNPVGGSVRCLLGDGIQTVTADGGWSVINRPKWVGFTNWDGFTPYVTSMPLVLDGWREDRPVTLEYLALWLMFRPATTPRDRPPIVRIAGTAVQFTHLDWVITSIDVTDKLLRPEDGAWLRVEFTLNLLQYIPANIAVTSLVDSPAAAAQERQATSSLPSAVSGQSYVVRDGDTLARIAAEQLGNAGRYREIADLNSIRDPNALTTGQELRMP